LHLEALASLLLFSGGVWPEELTTAINTVNPKRWAATGGNLGSVELYVVAHNVARLAPGLYFYQVHEHQLARISQGWGRREAAEFIRQAVDGTDRETPLALIISVAALYRVSQKYGPFAYRIINLDAGVALAQLQMVGSSLGLQTQLARRWADDVIAGELDLRELAEAVTGAMLIDGATATKQED
jgi:SagB-type dehydrogenase family enzyme